MLNGIAGPMFEFETGRPRAPFVGDYMDTHIWGASKLSPAVVRADTQASTLVDT